MNLAVAHTAATKTAASNIEIDEESTNLSDVISTAKVVAPINYLRLPISGRRLGSASTNVRMLPAEDEIGFEEIVDLLRWHISLHSMGSPHYVYHTMVASLRGYRDFSKLPFDSPAELNLLKVHSPVWIRKIETELRSIEKEARAEKIESPNAATIDAACNLIRTISTSNAPEPSIYPDGGKSVVILFKSAVPGAAVMIQIGGDGSVLCISSIGGKNRRFRVDNLADMSALPINNELQRVVAWGQ